MDKTQRYIPRRFRLIAKRTLSICAAVSGLVVSVTAFESSVMTLVIGASNCKLCNFCKLDRLRPVVIIWSFISDADKQIECVKRDSWIMTSRCAPAFLQIIEIMIAHYDHASIVNLSWIKTLFIFLYIICRVHPLRVPNKDCLKIL